MTHSAHVCARESQDTPELTAMQIQVLLPVFAMEVTFGVSN